jgi:hypothetical protein
MSLLTFTVPVAAFPLADGVNGPDGEDLQRPTTSSYENLIAFPLNVGGRLSGRFTVYVSGKEIVVRKNRKDRENRIGLTAPLLPRSQH